MASALLPRIDSALAGREPHKILLWAIAGTFVADRFYLWLRYPNPPHSLQQRFKAWVWSWVRVIPAVRAKIDRELGKTKRDLHVMLLTPKEGEDFYPEMPVEGLTEEALMERMKRISQASANIKRGRVSGAYYTDGDEHWEAMLTSVYALFSYANPLHMDLYPGLRKLESELCRWICDMWHGDADSGACLTSGGTESILMVRVSNLLQAVLAYRNRGFERGITNPELIVPVTVHAAFDKACGYFGVRIHHVPVDEETRRALINRNTIAIVGSAPGFPHGLVDPIDELSELAVQYDIGLHVDSCLGGFLEAGYPLDHLCDFRLPGVTSISCDTHKYGYAPKGTSALVYRTKELRRYQYFVQPNWPGAIYASPTMAGSRPGGLVAAAWAAAACVGRRGYVARTKKIMETTRCIEEESKKIPGLFVYGKPSVSVVAWGATGFDIWQLYEQMSKRGWHLNALQYPSRYRPQLTRSFHLCVTLMHTKEGVADEFLRDLRDGAEYCRQHPAPPTGSAAMYGMSQSIPDRSLVDDICRSTLDCFYEENSTFKPKQAE